MTITSTGALVVHFAAALAVTQPTAQPAKAVVSAQDLRVNADVPGFGAMLAYGGLRARVVSWTHLPQDWDGDDGQPLGADVAEAANVVLSHLEAHAIPAPTPYIAGDGEVGFRWETGSAFASISFLSDGHIVAFVRKDGQQPYRLDEPFDEGLTELATLVQHLANVDQV